MLKVYVHCNLAKGAMSYLKFWTNKNKMSPSAKVIEKLKQGIHGIEKGSECKAEDEPEEEPLPFAMDYLTPALIEEARTQLNETEETILKGLQELRELIKKEPKLVSPTDEVFLLSFLRARKHNVKKAFKLLQNYWLFRKEFKEIFDASNQTIVKRLILKNYFGFLTFRDRKGCVVMIFKAGHWDHEVDDFDDMFRAITAILIHAIQYTATQVAGFRVIIDFRELSWTQMKLCTPSNVLLLNRSLQYCFPARYKGFHILTENKLFNVVWTIAHPLLTSKMKKRVMLHNQDLSPLLEYIHPSVLPVEFGGDAPTFNNSSWAEIVEEGTDHVMNMLNYGYID